MNDSHNYWPLCWLCGESALWMDAEERYYCPSHMERLYDDAWPSVATMDHTAAVAATLLKDEDAAGQEGEG